MQRRTALFFLLLSFTIFSAPVAAKVKAAPVRTPPTVGSIAALTGQATLSHPNLGQRKATVGEKIYANDLVQTIGQSAITLRLENRETLKLGAQTKLRLTQYVVGSKGRGNAVLDLLLGHMRLWSSGKLETASYNVKTRNAVAGVRGTEFELAYAPKTDSTLVVVFDGKVGFGNRSQPPEKGREIPGGYWGEVRGKEPPGEPKPIKEPPKGFTVLGR